MYPEYQKDLALLDIEDGASLNELKSAFREMTKVWHPDRFAGDQELTKKAHEKLIEIKDAYERLNSYFAKRKFSSSAKPKESENRQSDSDEHKEKPNKNYDGNSVIHRFFEVLLKIAIYACVGFLLLITYSLYPRPTYWEQDRIVYAMIYFSIILFPFIMLIGYRLFVYIFYGRSVSFKFRKLWIECTKPTLFFILLLVVGYLFASSTDSKNSEMIGNNQLSGNGTSDEFWEGIRLSIEEDKTKTQDAYELISEADKLQKVSQKSEALSKYESALEILRNKKNENPELDDKTLTFRINYVIRRIDFLKDLDVDDSQQPKISIWDAAIIGDLSGIEQNINFGITVNATRNGETPLHFATDRQHSDAVKKLISLGASINLQNRSGNTPLHLAAMNGNLGICNYLMKNGALRNIRNSKGRTPESEALFNNHRETYSFIKAFNK